MKLKIRKANTYDIDDVINIMNEIEHPLFVKDDREYVFKHVNDEGFILVAEEDAIVGYLMVHYCEYDEDVNLHHIAYMDSVGVKKCARGHGLMKKLILEAQELLKDEYCYYMATVHPMNCYSLNVLLELGYEINQTVYRYNNKERYLMLKKTKI